MSDTLKFLYRQFFLIPPLTSPHQVNLQGQTGLVTGANIGLGLECSRQLLSLHISRLILAVRSLSKGEAARKELAASAPWATIEVWHLDMSSYASVQAFAARCNALPQKINFAVLNAGILKVNMEINPTTNHEKVLQVNYLSTALLAFLLLPALAKKPKKSAITSASTTGEQHPGTLTIVGSETAEWAKFPEQHATPILREFNNPALFDLQERYYTSKLLEEFFLVALSRRVPAEKCVVNVVNPGFCYGSGLHTEVTGVLGVVFGLYKRCIGRSTSVGARTLVDAAVGGKGKGKGEGMERHGRYLSDCRVARWVSRSWSSFFFACSSSSLLPLLSEKSYKHTKSLPALY